MNSLNPSMQGSLSLNEETHNSNHHKESTNSYENCDDSDDQQQHYALDLPSERPKQRYCCCRSRAAKIGSCLALLVILVVICGVTIIYKAQNHILLDIREFTFSNAHQTEQQLVNWAKTNPTSLKDLSLSSNAVMYLSGFHIGFMDVKVKNIEVVGIFGEDTFSKVGEGALTYPITTNQEVGIFPMPFKFSFSATDSASTSSLIDVLETCELVNGTSTWYKKKYEATLDTPLISWTGYKPTKAISGWTGCPINTYTLPNATAIKQLLNQIIN
ncbi:hypothetical protein K7432_016728 [Basidiobolus ranarum]|uniref:Uncharacterized protein n=1 Tax=Basidiobolus ranarum TaxID=34480 RepID=A0ABR2VLI7_9FUNG